MDDVSHRLVYGSLDVDRPHPRMRFLVVCLVLTTSAFIVLASDVWRLNGPDQLDRAAARLGITAGENGPFRHNARLAQIAERLGSRTGVGLGAVAVLLLAFAWRDWIIAAVAILSPLTSFFLIEYVAKPLVNEPIQFGGRMFPSGHAAGIAAVALTAVVLLHRRWGRVASATFAPFAAAVVVFVGLGVLRLDLHHYPTDVAGGAMLGAAVVLALTTALMRLALVVGAPYGRRRTKAPAS